MYYATKVYTIAKADMRGENKTICRIVARSTIPKISLRRCYIISSDLHVESQSVALFPPNHFRHAESEKMRRMHIYTKEIISCRSGKIALAWSPFFFSANKLYQRMCAPRDVRIALSPPRDCIFFPR